MPETPFPKLHQPAEQKPRLSPSGPRYAELAVATNFSFLRGASHPDELVAQAAKLGYSAIGVTDLNSFAGAVRMHVAAREAGLKLVVGTRLSFTDHPDLLVWPTHRQAYGRLCRLLTLGKRRAAKGACLLAIEDFLPQSQDVQAAIVPPRRLCLLPEPISPALVRQARLLKEVLGERLSLAAFCVYERDNQTRLQQLAALARVCGIRLLAANDVHYHIPQRRPLQDVLTCIRHRCSIAQAGFRLFPNAERRLKSPARMHAIFADHPRAVERALDVAGQCAFSLDELRYEYPHELSPPGRTPLEHLADLAWAGAGRRYPQGTPAKVAALIEHELKLIGELKIEAYFLTVYDLVRFARDRGILCQGRGSAANSAVCYCIGVTSVDPARIDVLFERFVSAARNEPPDIDIDVEHERREEVIQYVYEKYGRDRAGMTAEVITYRGRSAVRDVAKAMGLSLETAGRLAARLDGWDKGALSRSRILELGLDPDDRTIQLVAQLSHELLGFPRHLSQHVGGMVMTSGLLSDMVPIENASMPGRTVIEWDKQDIDDLGILKVDVLALGMLTCIAKSLQMVEKAEECRHEGGGRGGGGYTGGHDSHASELDRLAIRDAIGEGDSSGEPANAQIGTIRADPSDAQGHGVHSIEHRRGMRPAEHGGSSQISPDGASLPGGVVNSVRAFNRPEDVASHAEDNRSSCRGGSSPSRPDPQPGEKITLPPSPPSSPFVPPCLRASVPSLPDDPAVYDMICQADTVGVFQIESRAQMSMLPRLRPRNFYDLVIEVAIVRPGPIQGDMVHPYLRRRNGEEAVVYPSDALRQVLEKTLGVPLFQEQAMRMAMVAAGFSAEQADKLRRAMAAWRRSGALETFQKQIVDGMTRNGYSPQYAQQCFNQLRGFGEYGFPESHAASFALLVYVSAWLKRHHPAAFCCGLLNSQPMGFYAPAQIVRDAATHGVTVLPVDVNASQWDCTLAPTAAEALPTAEFTGADVVPQWDWGRGGPSVRLGFRMIRGLSRKAVDSFVNKGPFDSPEHFHRATGLSFPLLRRLAEADAFQSMGLSRRPALWRFMACRDAPAPLFDGVESTEDPPIELPPLPLAQEVAADYRTAGVSLKRHPVALVRSLLSEAGIISAKQLARTPGGKWVKVAGLVLVRQRPGTASGIVFQTLEDESGVVNLILRPEIYERYRPAAGHATFLQAEGTVERQGAVGQASAVIHVMVRKVRDLSHLLNGPMIHSRDFR